MSQSNVRRRVHLVVDAEVVEALDELAATTRQRSSRLGADLLADAVRRAKREADAHASVLASLTRNLQEVPE